MQGLQAVMVHKWLVMAFLLLGTAGCATANYSKMTSEQLYLSWNSLAYQYAVEAQQPAYPAYVPRENNVYEVQQVPSPYYGYSRYEVQPATSSGGGFYGGLADGLSASMPQITKNIRLGRIASHMNAIQKEISKRNIPEKNYQSSDLLENQSYSYKLIKDD